MKNLLLTVMLFAGNILMYAQFTCDSSMYLGQAPNAATNTTLYGINTSTNPLTYPAIGTIASIKYNAMGFHPATGYLYAMADASNNILRINSDGTYVNLGAVTNLPTGVMYNAGEIDSAGNFYVSASGTVNTLYRINIATLTATAIPLLSSLTVSDFAYNPIDGFLYGVHNTTGFLTRINTATGAVTTIGTAAAGTPFGAMMGSSTGAVYGVSNNGGFYQFNLTTGSRVLISGSPASLGNDGAHCVTAPITFSADLSITKTNGTTTYTAGTTTTYTIVARNNGPFGVLNASVTDSVPVGIPNANMTYTAVASAGSTTAVTGTQTGAINDLVSLPVNGTVTYTVTVNIPAGFTGNLTNTATITSPITSTDTNLSNNSATDTDVSACSIGTDSDGDGIADFCDLDDDNDGILDTDECGAYNRISNGTFPTTGGDTNTVPGWIVGGTYAGSGPWASPTGRVNLNSMGLEFRRDASTVTTLAQNLTNVFGNSTINLNNLYWNRTAFNGSVTTFIFTISYAGTVYATITGASNTPTITASNGASVNLSTLQTITTGAPPNGTLSTPVNLTITLPSSVPINGDLLFTFNAGTEPTQVNDLGFSSVSLLTCKDTDSDGIPDYLDLFSDTDGCSDAVEGDENVTVSQLNPNGSINVATTGGINTFGVPNLVNSGGAADIGGDQGQGVGVSQNALSNECQDIDNDGTPDYVDLDDDNDGILDVNEECNGFKAQMVTGSWFGTTPSNLTVSIPGASPRTNSGTDIILSQYPFHFNQNGAQPRYNKTGNINYTFAFSTPVPASEIAFGFGDLQSTGATFTVLVNGISPNGNFVTAGGNGQPYYNSSTGTFTSPNNTAQNLLLMGANNTLVSTITIVSTGVDPLDFVDFTFYGYKICDTDGDSISDKLDLDSDNDGCLDAIEGGDNVTSAQLVAAASGLSAGTSSSATNQNLCAGTGCIDAQGVPTVVNSGGAADISGDQGQGIGFSQSALFNECDSTSGFDCIKPGVAGTPLPTKVGILTKSNPSTQWPQNVPNGHIVLDGAEKGFVITHMTTAQRDALVPVEGMMIYNTTVNCVQLYRGTTPSVDSGRTGWNCLETACDGLPQRNVNVGYWGASGFNFFNGHLTFRNQLQTTTNYGPTGTFKGVSGWTWIDANTDVNATAATFTAAQMKAKYDMIVTGYNNMTAASAAKIKEYTDLGGVVFVLADGLQSAGNSLNTAFGGTGNISNGTDAQAGVNAQARTLNNAISNGIFGIGGGATITGAAGQAVPPVANIPAGSFITAYMNFTSATSTTNAGVYITGASGRAIFVYDEGIYRAGAVAGTVIDTPQEIFIHNLMSYALQRIGFSAQ